VCSVDACGIGTSLSAASFTSKNVHVNYSAGQSAIEGMQGRDRLDLKRPPCVCQERASWQNGKAQEARCSVSSRSEGRDVRGCAPASCNVVVAFAGRTNVLTGTSCLVLWGGAGGRPQGWTTVPHLIPTRVLPPSPHLRKYHYSRRGETKGWLDRFARRKWTMLTPPLSSPDHVSVTVAALSLDTRASQSVDFRDHDWVFSKISFSMIRALRSFWRALCHVRGVPNIP